jgi:hypothetical protein
MSSKATPAGHRNRSAIERTIKAMRAVDLLAELDAGTVAMLRTTAEALDRASSAYDVAIVGRVHATALAALLAGHRAEPPADDLDRFLAELRTTPLRDTPDA